LTTVSGLKPFNQRSIIAYLWYFFLLKLLLKLL
jgi:hypothetical protein